MEEGVAKTKTWYFVLKINHTSETKIFSKLDVTSRNYLKEMES